MSSPSPVVHASLRAALLTLLSECGSAGSHVSSLQAQFEQRAGRAFPDATGGLSLPDFLMHNPNDFVVEQPVHAMARVLLRRDWEAQAQQQQQQQAAQQAAHAAPLPFDPQHMAYAQQSAAMHAHHPAAMMYAQQQQQQLAAWQAQQLFQQSQAANGGPPAGAAAPSGGAGAGVGTAAGPDTGVSSSSATAAVLHLASFTTAGIIDELVRELPDSYGVSGGGLLMPIFHKCALSTSWGRALAAVHGDARAKERIEMVVRQNPDVFQVREKEGQPHAMVSLAPAMAKAFASASAPPTPTAAAAAKPPQTPQPKQATAAAASPAHMAASAAASPASTYTASATAQPPSSTLSRPPPSPAGAAPLLVTPLDLQDLLVAILRSSPHPLSLTSLGITFMACAKQSFNDACAAVGIAQTLSTFLRQRPAVFCVEKDARPEHPPIISLVEQGGNGAATTAGASSSTPARTHQTASAMSSPAAASVDLQGTLVSILRDSPRAMPIPTLATHFRERAGVAFKDTGAAQSMSEFLAGRPGVFRLEEDGRPQHPRLVSLANGTTWDATASASATPAQVASSSSSSSSGSAMSSPAPAPTPAPAGPSDAQQELIVHILRHAPTTPGSLPLATLTTVLNARTGYRFGDAHAAAAGKGTAQTLLEYLADRPALFRIWTEGVNRTHLVALKPTKEALHTPAGAGVAGASATSTSSQAASWRSTGGAAAAASPSTGAAGMDLQSELIHVLRGSFGTPGTMSLVSLGYAFFSRTGQRFNDACAAAGEAKSLLAYLTARPAVFHMWTEGLAQMVALVDDAAAAAVSTPAQPSLPSTPFTPGSSAAAPAAASAAAIDLQRVLVSLLAPSPDPMPLNVLADYFRVRTRFSFSDALAAGDKRQSMAAWLREHNDVFHVEADPRDQYPPLVSLVPAYRSRLRPAPATATAATPMRSRANSVSATPSSMADLSAAFADASVSTPRAKPQPVCLYWPKGFCHKGDQCSHHHDPKFDALNQQRAAEKEAAAEGAYAERAPAGEWESHGAGPGAATEYPSTTSGSAAATALPSSAPSPSPSRAHVSPAESAAVDLVCSLLPADGRPMLPSALGDAFIQSRHDGQTWAEYSKPFGGGASLQRWMERHPDRIVVDKTRGTTPGKVLILRAQVEGASGAGGAAAAAPRPYSHPSHHAASPASSSSPNWRVGVSSPPPSTATILGWVCALLLELPQPTTQTDLGQAMRRRHGVVFVSAGSAAERALKTAGGADAVASALTMKAFLRGHPNYFSLHQAGDEIEVRLVNRSAAEAAAAAVAGAAPPPSAPSAAPSSAYTTPQKSSYHAGSGAALASPSEYVTADSPLPSPSTILSWVLRILLASPRPITQSDLGQVMRQRHGLVFIGSAGAGQRALEAAAGGAPQGAQTTLSAFLHMPAHRHIFALVPTGCEIEVRLIDRQAASIIASSAPSFSSKSSVSSPAPVPAPAAGTPTFRPTVKRGTAPTQGLPLDGWSRASLSSSCLLGLLIGQPTQAVVPVGSGFYPIPGRPFGTTMLLSLLHRVPLASLWTAAFPDWETLYEFLRAHPSHFAPADDFVERAASARWVVRDDAVAAVSPVAAPTPAEAALLRTLEVVFRSAAPSQQQSDLALSPSPPALSLDAIGRGYFMERGVPFESSSGGVALADFLLHFRNIFCFTAGGPLLVVRFRPMEEEAQVEAQHAPAPTAPASASAPQPAGAESASASAPLPARKMPIAVLASTDEGGASSIPSQSTAAAASSSSSSHAHPGDWLGQGEVFFESRPTSDGASVSAQVAPSVDADSSPFPTPATSSVQRTVRMQVHVLGRDAPLSVSADCVAELRDELTQKMDEDEGALEHAHFGLYPTSDGRALPPALTDEQLWALPKNSAVYAVV